MARLLLNHLSSSGLSGQAAISQQQTHSLRASIAGAQAKTVRSGTAQQRSSTTGRNAALEAAFSRPGVARQPALVPDYLLVSITPLLSAALQPSPHSAQNVRCGRAGSHTLQISPPQSWCLPDIATPQSLHPTSVGPTPAAASPAPAAQPAAGAPPISLLPLAGPCS